MPKCDKLYYPERGQARTARVQSAGGCSQRRCHSPSPRTGSISYVSPVSRVLMGKAVGDVVVLGDHEIEVLAIAEQPGVHGATNEAKDSLYVLLPITSESIIG
jgi:hypothetical protein